MPDYAFTTPQVQPVRQSSLADMLTMARGAQAYQQEQQMNPLELRAKQMQVEQSGLMNPELYKAQVATTQTAQTGASSAALGLQNKIAQVATDEATSALNDPRLTALRENPEDPNARKAAMDVFLSARDRMINRGVNKHDAEMHVAPYLLQAGKGNPNLADELQNALAAGTGAAGQQAQINYVAPTAGTLNTGANILPTILTPSNRGSTPNISVKTTPLASVQLPPGSTNESTGRADVNGNTIYVQKDANGNVIKEFTATGGDVAKTPALAGVPAASPAMAAPARMRPGETPATYEDANRIRLNASIAASTDPVQQNNNNQIIKLASTATTGKFSELIRNLGGGYATVPWTGNKAEDFDKLGDYMARQTAALAASTGLGGTDAGRALQAEYVGHKGWTEGAIQETARLNRALSTGASFFNQALKTELAKPGSDAITARDFRDQWSNMLGSDGVDAIRLMDLVKNKDQEGMKKFITSIGGKDSTKYQSISEKASQINSLLKGR